MIKTYPDKILGQQCAPVQLGGVAFMEATTRLMNAWEILNPKPGGLSAPQVGFPYRVVLINEKGKPHIYYNPKVGYRTPMLVEGEEQCISLPGVSLKVMRPRAIVVQAHDSNLRLIRRAYQGTAARVWCHELDHLDGTLIIDKVDRDKRKEALTRLQGHDTIIVR